MFRCVVEFAAAVYLQLHHVEWERRFGSNSFFCYGYRTSEPGKLSALLLQVGLVKDLAVDDVYIIFCRNIFGLYRKALSEKDVGKELVVISLLMVLDLFVSCNYQTKRRKLDSSDRKMRVIERRKVARKIDSDDKVCHGAGVCCLSKIDPVVIIEQIGHCLRECFVGRIIGVDAHHLSVVVMPLKQLVDQKLTFIIGVTGMNDIFSLFDQSSDHLDPLLYRPVFRLFYFGTPVVKVNRQQSDVPFVSINRVVVFRLLECKQMAENPGHDVVSNFIIIVIHFFSLPGQHRRNVICELRLFGDYQNHGINLRVILYIDYIAVRSSRQLFCLTFLLCFFP